MANFLGGIAWLVAVAGVAVPGAVLALTPDNFQAASTRDIVTLCSTDPASPDYPTAISFCHGFAVGAYQFYSQTAAVSRRGHFVCLPDPPPSRSQAISQFVEWARSHPDTMSAPPVDSMFRYLGERYPCRS